MHSHYSHGQPFGGYYRYSRGPSRIWWFLIGAGAMAAWSYMHKQETEGRHFGWRRDRCVKNRDEDYAADTRGKRDDASAAVARNPGPDYGSSGENSRNEANWGSEPLWRLRGEKEAERLKTARDIEVREQLLNAREKVLHATESGLESLRQSLDSLTRMVQEQRKDASPREQSSEKKDQ